MKKSLAINIAKIGQSLQIAFGKNENKSLNSFYFEDLLTEWTKEFLESTSLSQLEDQKSKINGMLKLSREQNIYKIEGEIEFEPLLECVRSLTLFREKIKVQVNGYFVPENSSMYQNSGISRYMNSNESEEDLELSASDLETYSFKGNFIELDEFLIDTLYLALPELPLCQADCKGLCSECGSELNEIFTNGIISSPKHSENCKRF